MTLFGLVAVLLCSCKPASFNSVEQVEDKPLEQVLAHSSADAIFEPGAAVSEEAIEATEITKIESTVQVPNETATTNAEALKVACVDAKKNGTLKSKVIPLLFPAKTTSCDFEANDNLSRKNESVRARREEMVDLPLQGMTRLCNMKFDAPKQNMRFDDEIFLTLNNLLIASSQDYSTKSKDKNAQQVYPTGLDVDANGLTTYKWLPPNGLQNLDYLNGQLLSYCLGLDAAQADFATLCQIPKTDTNGTMQLTLPQDAFLKLTAKAGLIYDKQLQQLPRARLAFITTGDDNDSDCQHLDFQMSVTVDYIP